MPDEKKAERLKGIKELVAAFCREFLNEELEAYAMSLCGLLGRKRTLSISRGKKEIWAATVIYIIARLNFLFDPESAFYITPGMICNFFGTVKSTTGNKATLIMKTCNLGIGSVGFCSPKITDMVTFYETPEGFIIPKSAITGYEITDPEEAAKIERRMAEKRRKEEEANAAKKARRAEIKRKIAEEKRKEKEKNDKQLSLFDGF